MKFSEPVLMLINLGAVLAFTYSKIFLYKIVGFVFDCSNQISEYLFYTQTSRRVTAQILLPLTFLLYFVSGKIALSALILGVVIVFSFNVFSIFRGIKIIAEKEFSIYYLILYLCSLEILPLLIVWRILLSM